MTMTETEYARALAQLRRAEAVKPPPAKAEVRRARKEATDEEVLAYVQRNGLVNVNDVHLNCALSPQAAHASLDRLTQARRVLKEGRNNSTAYRITP